MAEIKVIDAFLNNGLAGLVIGAVLWIVWHTARLMIRAQRDERKEWGERSDKHMQATLDHVASTNRHIDQTNTVIASLTDAIKQQNDRHRLYDEKGRYNVKKQRKITATTSRRVYPARKR